MSDYSLELLQTQLAKLMARSIQEKENDSFVAKLHDNDKLQDSSLTSAKSTTYIESYSPSIGAALTYKGKISSNDSTVSTNSSESFGYYSSTLEIPKGRNSNHSTSPLQENCDSGTPVSAEYSTCIETSRWLQIRLPSSDELTCIALSSDVTEFRSVLNAVMETNYGTSWNNTPRNVVGLRDVVNGRVFPLSILCEGKIPFNPSHYFELLFSNSRKPSRSKVKDDMKSIFESSSVEAPNVENTDNEYVSSGPGETKDDVSDDYEDIKEFLLAFISNHTEVDDNSDVSVDTLMIPQRLSYVLEWLVKEGDGVVRSAYLVSEYCNDDEYLRCMMCTIAYNALLETEPDFEENTTLTHKDLEEILDVAHVIAEQKALPSGKFIALLHAILIRELPIYHAYSLYLNVHDSTEAVDVLLGALYEIGLSLFPVSRTDKLVEIEASDDDCTNASNASAEDVDELKEIDSEFELAEVTAEKLLVEGRFTEADKEIVLELIEDNDECLRAACNLFVEDLDVEEFESILISRTDIARRHKHSENSQQDQMNFSEEDINESKDIDGESNKDDYVDEENVDMYGLLEEATRLLVLYKKISNDAAIALKTSWELGNPVLRKICQRFVNGGTSTLFMQMLEDLVTPNNESGDFRDTLVQEPPSSDRLLVNHEQSFKEIIRVLLSTDLISKAGADYLVELARNGAPELLEALSIGFPSTVSDKIDEMINALIELADQHKCCDCSYKDSFKVKPCLTAPYPDGNTLYSELKSNESMYVESCNEIVPQALDESHTQYETIFSKCVDEMFTRNLITYHQLYGLIEMNNDKDAKLLNLFDMFYEHKDLNQLIRSLCTLVQVVDSQECKSDDETTCEKHCEEARPESASTKSVDMTYDGSFYSKIAPTEVKCAAEAFVSDLFGHQSATHETLGKDQDPLVAALLKEIKEWNLTAEENKVLTSCIERKDPSLQIALNSFRANPDVEEFGVQLKNIAHRVIDAEGFIGVSTN